MMTDAEINGQEMHLVRRDIASLASNSPGCMVLYPIGKKSRQRIGIGNKTGDVSVFVLNNSLERTPVFDTPPQSKPVSCVTLYEDQIFFVHGSNIEAYSRKGKHFFSFDTNVTETIHSIFVSTPYFITCGSFMVTSFQEVKELGFYVAPDRINAMDAFVATSALERTERTFSDYQCVIGCNDHMIRVLRDHKLTEEIRCDSSLSALCVSHETRKLYYGTHAGSLGCLDLSRSDASLPRDFVHAPGARESAVTALALFDVNEDGRAELLVGRQDGTVQVFLLPAPGPPGPPGSGPGSGPGPSSPGPSSPGPLGPSPPGFGPGPGTGPAVCVCVWAGHADECVLAVAGGFVTHARRPDVLAQSFSGRLAAFARAAESPPTTEGGEAKSGDEAEAERNAEAEAEAESRAMRAEIDALRRGIADTSRALAELTGAAKLAAPLVAVASTFTARVQLTFLRGTPALLLVVEADTPMQCVALQSDVALCFVDADDAPAAAVHHNSVPHDHSEHAEHDANSKDYNSTSACEGGSGPLGGCGDFGAVSWGGGTRAVLLPLDECSYRCGAAFFAADLQWGTLRVTILAAPTPRTAQVRHVLLPPLPLLTRVSDEPRSDSGDMSTLELRGSFGGRDVHAWLSRLLPGVPERFQANGPVLRYESEFFSHTFLNVSYGEGVAKLSGNSILTLAIARRFLASCAVQRTIEVRFQVTVHDSALRTDLQHIIPRVVALNCAKRDLSLLEALHELDESDDDDAVDEIMLEEHRDLLAREDEVTREGKQAAQWENYLYRTLIALHESAAEMIPGTPKTSPATRRRLKEIMQSSCDEGELIGALEQALTSQGTEKPLVITAPDERFMDLMDGG